MTVHADSTGKLCYVGVMTLYFAYGSNMDRSAMKRRCPGARAVGPAILEDYRFFVGIDGWGSVNARRGDTVHGVLWRLTRAILQRFTPTSFCTKVFMTSGFCRFVMDRGVCARSFISCAEEQSAWRDQAMSSGSPAAARKWNCPEPYVRSVERWSNWRYTGARAIDREIARE